MLQKILTLLLKTAKKIVWFIASPKPFNNAGRKIYDNYKIPKYVN